MAMLWAGRYGAVVQLDLEKRQLWVSGAGKQRQALEALIRSGPGEAAAPLESPTGLALGQW